MRVASESSAFGRAFEAEVQLPHSGNLPCARASSQRGDWALRRQHTIRREVRRASSHSRMLSPPLSLVRQAS